MPNNNNEYPPELDEPEDEGRTLGPACSGVPLMRLSGPLIQTGYGDCNPPDNDAPEHPCDGCPRLQEKKKRDRMLQADTRCNDCHLGLSEDAE